MSLLSKMTKRYKYYFECRLCKKKVILIIKEELVRPERTLLNFISDYGIPQIIDRPFPCCFWPDNHRYIRKVVENISIGGDKYTATYSDILCPSVWKEDFLKKHEERKKNESESL